MTDSIERIRIEPDEKQLTQKELAYELGKSLSYVKAMQNAGFEMAFHPIIRRKTASVESAHRWLIRNQDFRSHHWIKRK